MPATPPATEPSPNAGRVATAARRARQKPQDPLWVRVMLTSLALLVLTILVIVPVVSVFYEALSEGLGTYWHNLTADPDTRHAILLTLTVAPLAVLCNLVF